MRIPARFLRVSSAYNGVSSKEGWLEIDIRALDMDGVTKLHVNLDEVAGVWTKRDSAASALSAWDKAFGRADDEG
jgi:hypothetical protein